MNCFNCQILLIFSSLSIINCFTFPMFRFFSTSLFNFNCFNNQLGIAGLMGYDTSTASTAQLYFFLRGVYVNCFNCQKLLFLPSILIINCFNCLTVIFFCECCMPKLPNFRIFCMWANYQLLQLPIFPSS